MVATERVGAIIMLCDLVEEGQRKCADYYPHDDGTRIQYGDVGVQNVSVGHSTLPRVQITILRITYKFVIPLCSLLLKANFTLVKKVIF